MRRLYAFLTRDFRIESSYRFAFLLNFSGILLSAVTFFFISELIGEAASPYLSDFNGDYFSFVIIGTEAHKPAYGFNQQPWLKRLNQIIHCAITNGFHGAANAAVSGYQ